MKTVGYLISWGTHLNTSAPQSLSPDPCHSDDGDWDELVTRADAEAAIAAAVAKEREAWESAVDSQCLPDRAHQIVVTANGNRIKAAIRARKEPTA